MELQQRNEKISTNVGEYNLAARETEQPDASNLTRLSMDVNDTSVAIQPFISWAVDNLVLRPKYITTISLHLGDSGILYSQTHSVGSILFLLDSTGILNKYFFGKRIRPVFIFEVQSNLQHVGSLRVSYVPMDQSLTLAMHGLGYSNPAHTVDEYLGNSNYLNKIESALIPLGMNKTYTYELPWTLPYSMNSPDFDPTCGRIALSVGTPFAAAASVTFNPSVRILVAGKGLAYSGYGVV